MNRIIDSSLLIATIIGLFLCFYVGVAGYADETTLRTMSVLVIIGVIGLFYRHQERQSERDKLVWFFPGDKIKIIDVSGRTNLKKLIGKQLTVHSYSFLTREIYAEDGDLWGYFKPHEVEVVARSEQLTDFTRKHNKHPKFHDS